MNLNSREIRRLNILFFNRRCLWRCRRCCLGSKRLPERLTNWLFCCLWLLFGLLFCTRLFEHFSLFIQLLLLVQETAICYLNFYLKVSKCIKSHRKPNLPCNQNIKEDIHTALGIFLCFKMKRNDINRSSTKTSTQRASNIRVRTGYNVWK